MSLQFVDFNADGQKDIVTATFEGTVFQVLGSESGWQQPDYIRDAEDRPIVLSLFFDMQAKENANADRSPAGTSNPKDHLISAFAWDWDNDGDYDLLLGAKEGRLYLQRNEGKKGAPSFVGTNTLLKAGGEDFNVPGGMTAARPVDWDADGLTDLVCGSFEGGAYLYRNTGKLGAPSFAAPVSLLKPAKSPAGNAGPETGWYVDPVDFDADGDLDLLVGGYFQLQPKPRILSETEQKRLDEVDAELKEVNSKHQKFFDKMEKETKDASNEELMAAVALIQAIPEYKVLNELANKLRKEQLELRPRAKRTSGVWLYRNQQTVAKKGQATQMGS